MKRILIIALTVIMFILTLTGCTENVSEKYPTAQEIEYATHPSCPKYEVKIRCLRYTWDGWGISGKTVGDSEAVYNVIEALNTMKETGKIVPKISDDIITEDMVGQSYDDCPVERGTLWIEYDNKIYRLTPDLSQICLVETHFGEGKILEITEDFKLNVNRAWFYAPFNYYQGTYNRGDTTVELKNVYQAESSVQISVENIHVESKYSPNNSITLKLISEVDQDVLVSLDCQQSDDNLAAGDRKAVKLQKDVPTLVTLNFGGWPNYRYWVYIRANFTKVEITINP